jgi:hypothetical protein
VKYALVLLALLTTLIGRTAGAVTVFKDEEKGVAVNVGLLAQPWFQMTTPGVKGNYTGPCGSATRPRCSAGIGSPKGGPSYDFFLRRARLMLWGSATKELSFFIETDEPNLGKGGTYTTSSFIQDAFLTYAFVPELKLDAGLMLVPLTHHTIEGATGLNALDYHAEIIRFPAGRIFRDVGVQLRGLALGDHLHYRVGVFGGVRNSAVPPPAMPPPTPRPPLNHRGQPRFTAMVRGNIVGSEPDFFMKGIYFSKDPIVSIGVGADYQRDSTYQLNGRTGRYLAVAADVFAEVPFSEADEIIFKGSGINYGEGTSLIGTNLPSGGIGAYAELGFRHDFIEPVVFIEYLKARASALNPPLATVKIVSPHVGVNFWISKHTFNVKTDLGHRYADRVGAPPTKDVLWTTQGQVFF